MNKKEFLEKWGTEGWKLILLKLIAENPFLELDAVAKELVADLEAMLKAKEE